MAKKSTALASRAWNLLRLALYWARKGGIFKRGLMTDMLPNFLKSLRSKPHNSIYYGEKEFSFDETPMFNFKSHRSGSMRFRYLPHIPCINPPLVNFEDDEDEKSLYRRSLEEDYEGGGDGLNDDNEEGSRQQEGDDEIDNKAEEFIARFYEKMKLQRQISYLQYKEMLQRGTT
eukprot:TRINITY_DN30526_c0_g1_i1.p1 TRINITY_DN30526_c0_g1~~TRINITY_DN30526_c0_g1_i1.p1  ORF type:complete len:174 (-),score=46.52 TRINITY_DN30526_c0_g1_i1:49-570(-)